MDLSNYQELDIKEPIKISDLRERVLRLFHEEIPEDIVEYMLEPFEKILTHHGVNLNEQTSH